MSGRYDQIIELIARYRRLKAQINDKRVLEAADGLIAELEAEQRALPPKIPPGAGLWRVVLVSVGITFILLMFGGKLEKSVRRTVLGRHSEALANSARADTEDEETRV